MARVQAFRTGQVVQLRSGGPKMTVTANDLIGDYVNCSWFAGAKLNHGSFTPDALIAISEDEPKKGQ